jgi:hypothetical protein
VVVPVEQDQSIDGLEPIGGEGLGGMGDEGSGASAFPPLGALGDKWRGSSGYTAMAGVNLRLAGTLFGEIAVGWGEQQPIDDSFAIISGPLINGDLIWMATPSTKLEFLARSSISETSLDESAGAVDRFFQLGRNRRSGAISCSEPTRPTKLPTLPEPRSSISAPNWERPRSTISIRCCRPMSATNIPTSPAVPTRLATSSRTRSRSV